MILDNKFRVSTNILWIFSLLIIYSCNKYSHHVKNNIAGGIVLSYDYNGDINTNKYDAEVTAYYPSGEINSHYKVINGKSEGFRIDYYKNGTIKAEGNYENSMKEGTFVSYYQNGNKISEVNYKDGKREGIAKFYYQNGQIEDDIRYLHDKFNGLSWRFYPNGKLSNFGLFKDSTIIYSLQFDTAGKILTDRAIAYIKFPDTIRLGEKFRLEFTYPVLKGFTNLSEFNAAIIFEKTSDIDTMKDYTLYSKIRNNKWVYELKKKKKKITIDNYKGPLYNIPLNEQGYGVYEYTPSNPGSYSIQGISGTVNIKGMNDTAFIQDHIRVQFTVIK